MKAILAFFGILVGLILLLFLYAIGSYNGLVNAGQKADSSWANVQNVYQRRMDLIPNLVNTVQAAATFEKSTFTDIAKARASVGQMKIDQSQAPKDAKQLAEFQAAQGQLGNALSRLMMITENYPQLKANENFRDLQAQLEGTENRIAVERRTFNLAVQDYNVMVKSFPVVFFAGAMGYQSRPYFQAEETAQKAPTVKFN